MSRDKLRSPLKWFGGKFYLVPHLLQLIPPHQTFVEVFGGGAQLLFAKKPQGFEVYNDLDSGLVTFFRVLRDEEKFPRLLRLLYLTPYSREEYVWCREHWEEEEDEVVRAYRWFVVARMSFSGAFGHGWSFCTSSTRPGLSVVLGAWWNTIEMLPQMHERLKRVQVEHYDFRKIFDLYDAEETFFYCDPPYVPDTRREDVYPVEMSVEDHQDLVACLVQLRGMVVLSGYYHVVYEPLEEAGWTRYEVETVCNSVGRTRILDLLGKVGKIKETQTRTECIWVCPKTMKRLKQSRASLFDM